MCAKKTATTKPSTGNKLQQQQPANSSSSSSNNLNKNRDKKLIKSNSMVDNKNDLKQQQQQQLSSTALLVISKKKTNLMNNLTPVAPTATTILTTSTSSTTPNISILEKIATVKSKASTGTTITATSSPSASASKTMKKSKEIGVSDGDCKTTIKISNELKNLGVNMAKSASAVSSCDETMPNEVKTSICEMVKTKTRICVTPQSTISSKSQTTLLQDIVKPKVDLKLNKESQEKKTKSSDAKIKSTKKAASLEIATIANQNKQNELKTEDSSVKMKKDTKPKESKLKKEKSNLEKATESTAVKNIQSSTSNNMDLEENNKKDFPSDTSATPKKKYVKKQKDPIIDKQIDTNNTSLAPASSAASTPVKRKYVKKKKPGEESEKTSADNSSAESSKKKKTVQSNVTDKVEPKNGQKKITTPKEPKESKVKKAKIVQKDEQTPSAIKTQKEILNVKTGFEVEYSLEKPKSDELLKTEPSDKETKITVKDINSLLEQKPVKQTEVLIKEENNAVVISMEKELTTNKTTTLAVILPAIATKIKRKYIRKNLPTSSQPIIKKSSKKQSDLPVADVRGNLRTRKVKQFGAKRTRVASLNAIAKVHCLYENEARSALETNIHNAEQMAIAAQKQKCGYGSTTDDEDDDANINSDKDMQAVIPRSLRTAPGLRGIGKHWEMDSMSSEIDSDSDASQKNIKEDNKMKSKKKPAVKKQTSKQQAMAQNESKAKAKSSLKKVIKKSPKHKNSDDSQDDNFGKDEDNEIIMKKNKKQQAAALKKLALATAAATKKKNESIKRKKAKDDDKIGDKNVVAKKRMASMNASAILAANYEVDNYATKLETSSEESSDSSNNEEYDQSNDIEPPTTKKDKKDLKRELQEPRPKSTTVKIDTDVTITGEFYVNSAVGSQETIRKTLYHRTAYSVTEERVVRPPIQEPPKSYTPLSALGNMRPPGGQLPPDPCMTSPPDQFHPQPPPIFDPQMGPIPPYQYPQQPNPHPNFPPHSMPSTSSAFYSPQQMHRDPMGGQRISLKIMALCV
ncbi:unnamed protein product [Diamesa serratosioi]